MGFPLDASISHLHSFVRDGGGFGAVCCHQHGRAKLTRRLPDELQHRFAAGGIEIAGRFISNKQQRLVH